LERSGIMGWKEKFFISKYEIIFGYPFESCKCGIDCERRRVVLGPRFLNFGSYSRPKFERSGIMGWKEKLFISKYEIIFLYPFESCTHGLDCERRSVVVGPLFLNFGSYSRPKFGTKWNYCLERKILHFQ
jgi:hypothetical protein